MKLGVMQPYIFPYIGYFHLIHSVDKFIFLDDVSYINKGWINRNRLAQDTKHDYLFTIPLEGASQNKKINEIRLHENFVKWRATFHKTFSNFYAKAPHVKTAEALIFTLLYDFKPGDLISDLTRHSVQLCYQHIEGSSSKEWVSSSSVYGNEELKKGDRLIDICHKEGAQQYHNAIGGQEIYTREQFAEKNVSLFFIKSELKAYRETDLVGLSIIDLLCYCDQETLQKQLRSYHLV